MKGEEEDDQNEHDSRHHKGELLTEAEFHASFFHNFELFPGTFCVVIGVFLIL